MPLPQGFREWLAKESQLWHEQGVLQPGQRDQILARYPEEAGSGRLAFALRVFGVLLLFAATLLVVAHNWSELPRGARLAAVIAVVALLQGVGLWHTFRARRTGSVLGHLAGCLMFGAGVALVGQTYHMDAHSPDAVLAWCLATLPFALALESTLLHLVTLSLAAIWMGMEMSGQEFASRSQLGWLQFTYLLLLLPSMAAAYRNQAPVIAGAVAWALMIQWLPFGRTPSLAAFVLPLGLAAAHPAGNPYGHGLRAIGTLGVTAATIMFGMLSVSPLGNKLSLFEDPALLSATLLAAGWALWVGIRDKDSSCTWPAVIALGTLGLGLGHQLTSDSGGRWAIIIASANLLTLATAVWLVRTGLSEGRLRTYVHGALVFLAWLTARYVDIAKEFGMLGTAGFFAVLGLILFGLARLWNSLKEKAGPQPVRPFALPLTNKVLTLASLHARPVLVVATLMQALGLIWMTWHHARPAEEGQRFRLRCMAVDPRDLLRGEYVILRYECSQPDNEAIDRLNAEWAELHGQPKPAHPSFGRMLFPEDAEVYVPLTRGDLGITQAGPPTLRRPTSGPFLKGFGGQRRFGTLRFGIEAYFVKEGTGHEWEKLRDQGQLVAEIGLLPDGRAGLIGLRKLDTLKGESTPFRRLESYGYVPNERHAQSGLEFRTIRMEEDFTLLLRPQRPADPPAQAPDFTKEFIMLLTLPATEVDSQIRITSVERLGATLWIRYRRIDGSASRPLHHPTEAVVIRTEDASEIQLGEEGRPYELLPLRL